MLIGEPHKPAERRIAVEQHIPFSVEIPDFSFLDMPKNKKKGAGLLSTASRAVLTTKKHGGLLAAARSEENKILANIPEVESLAPADTTPFSLTGLGKQQPVTKELSSEPSAIVEQDGLYIISDDVEIKGVKQDPLFKKLVESVMQ